MFKQFVGAALAATVLSAVPAVAEDAAGGPGADQVAQARKMMGPVITEELYASYLKLLTAVQTSDARLRGAKDEAAKAEIQKTKDEAFKTAGMDPAAYQKIGQEINMIKTLLASATQGVNNAQMQQALQMFEPVSVATVKAHLADPSAPIAAAGAGAGNNPAAGASLPHARPATDPAGAPAGGMGTDNAGTPAAAGTEDTGGKAPAAAAPLAGETEVDPAKLSGTWVLDLDATIELIKPGLPANQKQMVMGMMKGQMHIDRMVIGPGKAATAYSQNPDGTETKDAGTWSYANKQITIKHDDATQKDDVMDVAMRGELLMVGKGKDKAAFKRKTE